MVRWHRIALASALLLFAAACAGADSPTESSGPRYNSGYGVGSNETKSDSTQVPPTVTSASPTEEDNTLSEEGESSGYGVGSN